MDSFELNKIMGALLATCLGVLSLNIAAGAVFAPARWKSRAMSSRCRISRPAGGEAAKPEPAEPIAVRLAVSDPKKGETAAKQCAACHTFEKGGPNRVGPNLYGIVDRAKASVAGLQLFGGPEGQGRDLDLRRSRSLPRQSEGLAARHQHGLCRSRPAVGSAPT